MKFLIAGFGSIGRRHLRNLRVLGEENILLYRTHHSTLPEAEINDVPVETNLEAALAHHPDAVIISNPTALHMDVAIPAAEAGCHILMEKPIADSLAKVDHLRAALASGKGQLLVGFQFRYHPALRQIKTWLEEGAIGKVYSFRAHWGEYLPNWHPWEDYKQSYAARPELGGGVVLTLTHPMDYLRWLLGDVQSLWAFTGTLGDLKIKVTDSAEIGLQFKTGPAGTVHVDYLQRPAGHTLQTMGTDGMVQWDNASGSANLYQAKSDRWEKFSLPTGFDRNDLFLDELRHFIRVIQGLENPVCTLSDGEWALRLALSAHQSAQSGTQVHF